MEIWLLSAIIIFISSILQTSTGFGFALIATPFLVIIYEVHDAIQVILILQIIISLIMFKKINNEIDKTVFANFFKGSIVGLPIGILIFLYSDVRLLKLSVAIIILLMTVLLLFNFRVKQSTFKELIVGWLSGLMTASIGIPGIPLLIYFAGTKPKKEISRGTSLAFFTYICTISLILQVIFAGTTMNTWTISLVSTPVTIVGLILGHILFTLMNQKTFQYIMYLLLACSGSYLLYTSI